MSWWVILLIILGGLILLGPLMLLVSKLNGVDPWVLDRSDDIIEDKKSFMVVSIFYPLFFPLWIETKLIKYVKSRTLL